MKKLCAVPMDIYSSAHLTKYHPRLLIAIKCLCGANTKFTDTETVIVGSISKMRTYDMDVNQFSWRKFCHCKPRHYF